MPWSAPSSAFANDFENLGGGYVIVGQDCVDGEPVFPPVGLKDNQLDPKPDRAVGTGRAESPVQGSRPTKGGPIS